MWPELMAFAGVMALGQFSPGPDMLLLTRTSLAQGRAAGWWTTVGITTGLCLHAAVAIFGMAFLMARGGWFAAGLRWAAAGYLAWLAIGLLRSAFAGKVVTAEGRGALAGNPAACYRRGLLCNLLNPKAALFFAGIVAPFLSGERPGWWPAALWGIIVGQGLVLWGLYVLLLQFPPFQRGYQRAQRGIDAAFGLGLAALAVLVIT
ncbi:MAG: LysE family translocator [Akkermansiaceae bacterium]|nr:LysE family translocator [Akkermansiaceae bacterium]NNM30193.1 LysE family translocator [Akkermansiaceae bacterium]